MPTQCKINIKVIQQQYNNNANTMQKLYGRKQYEDNTECICKHHTKTIQTHDTNTKQQQYIHNTKQYGNITQHQKHNIQASRKQYKNNTAQYDDCTITIRKHNTNTI